MILNKIIPKTKKECFALLDEMLSEEDKRAIVEKGVVEFHFTLGLWIRNNWFYPQSLEETEDLLKSFGGDSMYCHPDDYSSIILQAYRKHLKRVIRTE
jgi:hypothetical protein